MFVIVCWAVFDTDTAVITFVNVDLQFYYGLSIEGHWFVWLYIYIKKLEPILSDWRAAGRRCNTGNGF